jgi:hypothetical protein
VLDERFYAVLPGRVLDADYYPSIGGSHDRPVPAAPLDQRAT